MSNKLADDILDKLVNSYPCKTCFKLKRYQTELRTAKKMSGGYSKFNKEVDDSVRYVNSQFLTHVEKVHLPSKEEWDILNKS